MAIASTLAIGKGRKSAGGLTYRYVRGRLITSAKIENNNSNTALQAAQRISFRDVSKLMSKVAFLINRTYDKSQYGSSRNNFYKVNKAALKAMENAENIDNMSIVDALQTLLNADLAYITYGAGNVLVSSTNAVTEGISEGINFQAFNVKEGECSAECITIVADGTVDVSPVDAIRYDQTLQSASMLASEYVSTLPVIGGGTQDTYRFIVFRTSAGIAKCKFYMFTQGEGA